MLDRQRLVRAELAMEDAMREGKLNHISHWNLPCRTTAPNLTAYTVQVEQLLAGLAEGVTQ